MIPKLCLAQDPEADELLSASPMALLIGMCLDQQIPLEVAFAGPKKLADRMAAASSNRVAHGQQKSMRMFIYRNQTFPASRSITATRISTAMS
ncbi:hypothetical protein A9W99_12645 [Mycobacterium sp. 1164966.3]|nr:hypothetical protein A9W99_12645 [Mycobacterium sp. 1164966.3]